MRYRFWGSVVGIMVLALQVSAQEVTHLTTLDVYQAGETGLTSVEAINQAGLVVGNLIRGPQAFALARTGQLRAIACDDSGSTAVKALNARGQVAGWCQHEGRTVGYVGEPDGTLRLIEFPGATLTEILALNNRGQVAGDYRDTQGTFHGFFTAGEAFFTLDIAGAQLTAITGLNNRGARGQLVGFLTTAAGVTEGFLLTGTTVLRLQAPGARATLPLDINDAGTIVGLLVDEAGLAQSFIRYANGTFQYVNVPRTHLLTEVLGVSATHQLVGRYLEGQPGEGTPPLASRGFVLTLRDGEELDEAALAREPVPQAAAAQTAMAGARATSGLAWYLNGCADATPPRGHVIPSAVMGWALLCPQR